MKKLIFALLIILPVSIIALTAFAARGIAVEIKEYNISYAEFDFASFGDSFYRTGYIQKRIYMDKGESIDLTSYITVYPKRANKFSLIFESEFPDIVSVDCVTDDGQEKLLITAHNYMDPNAITGYVMIICKSDDEIKEFFILNIQVNP
ncbi:MAG: hypothetical protein FWG51_02000 [Firmicutes bacterium]|nr:hypothetical protein [Bacillota bacterium]